MENITKEDLKDIIILIQEYNGFLIGEYNSELNDDEFLLLNKLKSILNESN